MTQNCSMFQCQSAPRVSLLRSLSVQDYTTTTGTHRLRLIMKHLLAAMRSHIKKFISYDKTEEVTQEREERPAYFLNRLIRAKKIRVTSADPPLLLNLHLHNKCPFWTTFAFVTTQKCSYMNFQLRCTKNAFKIHAISSRLLLAIVFRIESKTSWGKTQPIPLEFLKVTD